MGRTRVLGATPTCHTYMTYVKPPRPMEVKKLIANLVSFGLSLGKIPSNAEANIGSLNFSLSLGGPINSLNSWNKILTKMRLQKKTSPQ